MRSEGERAQGAFQRADAEAFWSHAVASYWDAQVGVRHDFGRGADRTWAAFGVQGLAPYGFEIDATAYVGDARRCGASRRADYDLSLTQRLILQPRVEVNAYGKDDPAAHVGSGVSDAEVGLRLRYEFVVSLRRTWGSSGRGYLVMAPDFAQGEGWSEADTKWVVGLRVWY